MSWENDRSTVPPIKTYFFLLAAALAFVACWAVISAFFFWFAPSLFDCFCEACFCVDFGDLSPMGSVFWLSCLTFGMDVSPSALVFILKPSSHSEPKLHRFGLKFFAVNRLR